jgi:prophage regulatory protein
MPMRTSLPRSAAATKPLHAAESGVATNSTVCLPDTGFLRQRQVLAFVPISKSTLWRQVRARSFPSPVKLSARVTAWRAEDVRRWITEQGGS